MPHGNSMNVGAAPAFADVKRGNLRLLLSGSKSSADRPFIVDDLDTEVARLEAAGATFRNVVVQGPGGKQILLIDPACTFVELFEPASR